MYVPSVSHIVHPANFSCLCAENTASVPSPLINIINCSVLLPLALSIAESCGLLIACGEINVKTVGT